jgi:hypothetical protein
MKIVINSCYGGFGLSHDAVMLYAKKKGITLYYENDPVYISYYLCPIDEFKRIKAEDALNPIGSGRYERTNTLFFSDDSIKRNDPLLVEVVEELGDAASGKFAALKVVTIPDGVAFQIDEYDGMEHIAEIHRTWH